jgi:hypothetical protein
MNQKQLANVLITILGLSICVHAIPAVIAATIGGVEFLIQAMHDGHPNTSPMYWTYSMTYFFQAVVEFVIGIYLIIRSRWLTNKLFKDE